jgi:hypothetical protein
MSFAQWHREGVQADRREQYPLTLGYVSYETLRRVGVLLGVTLTLMLPGEYARKHAPSSHSDDTHKNTPVSERIATILSVAK